jgi:hypothetical protein
VLSPIWINFLLLIMILIIVFIATALLK